MPKKTQMLYDNKTNCRYRVKKPKCVFLTIEQVANLVLAVLKNIDNKFLETGYKFDFTKLFFNPNEEDISKLISIMPSTKVIKPSTPGGKAMFNDIILPLYSRIVKKSPFYKTITKRWFPFRTQFYYQNFYYQTLAYHESYHVLWNQNNPYNSIEKNWIKEYWANVWATRIMNDAGKFKLLQTIINQVQYITMNFLLSSKDKKLASQPLKQQATYFNDNYEDLAENDVLLYFAYQLNMFQFLFERKDYNLSYMQIAKNGFDATQVNPLD